MTQPLVSILTPSYHQARFLPDQISSIKSQSYRPIEHIICDGGSEDGTKELLASYSLESGGVQVTWRSEADRGQAHAINKAFELSSGEIIGWLNSDDVYFHKGVVERVVAEFSRHPDVDVIHADVAKISGRNLIGLIWCIPDFNYERMFVDGKVSQPTVFFRRKVFEENKLNENILCLDYEFWLRLGRKYSFLHIKDVFAGDRDHPYRISRLQTLQLMEAHKNVKEEYFIERSKFRLFWFRAISLPMRFYYRLVGLLKLMNIKRHPEDIAFEARLDSTPKLIKRQLFTRIGNLFKETE